jgi:gas vesicle protein
MITNSNMDNLEENTGNIAGLTIGAFFIGLAAGTIAAILLAPDKGTALRGSLIDNINTLQKALGDRARIGIDRLSELKNQAVDTVRTKVGSIGQRAIDDPSFAYESTVSNSSTIPVTTTFKHDWLSN